MASSPDTSDWQKRYLVIEKAYCQARWSTVMEAGTLLLRELLDAGDHPDVKALRHRMQLLMAHTLLHGYGDRDAAEDLYEVVRQSDAEAALRQMAEDGLDQCHQPLNAPLVDEEDEGEESLDHSRPTLFLPETERADLEGAGEIAPADAQAFQMPATPLPRNAAKSKLEPEQESPPEAAAPSPAQASPSPLSSQEGLPNLGLAADPFSPASGGAPAEAQEIGAPVMPWLSQPSPNPVEEPVVQALPWEEPPLPTPLQQPLIPDVVEEPELIELHLATPSLAEEVELPIQRDTPATRVLPSPLVPDPLQDNESSMEDGELRAGLLLVVVR